MGKTKTSDLGNLAFSSGIILLISVVGSLLMFFFRLLVPRYFGAEVYGVYVLSETVLNIFALFLLFGLPDGLKRFLPIYRKKREFGLYNGFMSFSGVVLVIINLFFSALLYFFSGTLTDFFGYSSLFETFIKFVAIMLPFRSIRGFFAAVLVANKKNIYSSLSYQVIEKIILMSGLILVLVFEFPASFLIILLLIAHIITAGINYIFFKRHVPFVPNAKREYSISEWIKFSLPLIFSGVFVYLISWTDSLVIGKILDPASLGVYSVSYSLAGLIFIIALLFSGFVLPIYATSLVNKNHENIRLVFQKTISWSIGLGAPFFAVFLLFGKIILNIFFGAEFVAGHMSLYFLSAAFLISAFFGTSSAILLLHKKSNNVFFINVIFSVLNLLLNAVLVTYMGFLGAAIATLFILGMQNLTLFLQARRFEKITLPFFTALKYIFASLISAGIVKFIFGHISNIVLAISISLIIFLFVYVSILLLIKVFDDHDIEVLTLLEEKSGLKVSKLKFLFKYFH